MTLPLSLTSFTTTMAAINLKRATLIVSRTPVINPEFRIAVF